MASFGVKDAALFFGRKKEIDELLRRLRVQNYLFVIGPSGSGKSSLVFAGLAAQLLERQPNRWLVKAMRPGEAPLTTLEETIGDVVNLKTFEPSNLHPKRLLLIVDQFEELFAQSARPHLAPFIAALKSLRRVRECSLVLTMRADFYADLMNSDLWPVDPSERMEIASLRGAALAEAITKPAEAAGVYIEGRLLDRLLADATDEPGMLPFVQETMVLLWDNMDRHLLSLSAYQELGQEDRSGLAVALATRADAVLAQLDEAQRVVARRIILRLVQFGEGHPDTRRRQSISQLLSASHDPEKFYQTLDHLAAHRLLTLSGDERDRDKKVDIVHEALINGWPTMRRWLEDRRVAEQTRRRLEDKAGEWVRLGRETAGLLDEVELKEAGDWLDSPDAADIGYDENLARLVQRSRDVLEAGASARGRSRSSASSSKHASWRRRRNSEPTRRSDSIEK